jgi:hypothetical protein
MSWFTEETICMRCANDESELRKKIPFGGSAHEGCGFVPDPLPSEPGIAVGDTVMVLEPEDTVASYHGKIGRVGSVSLGRPYKFKSVLRTLDGAGLTERPCPLSRYDCEEEDEWVTEKVWTGPEYWLFIVYFEDKSLDLDFLPFREEDLIVLKELPEVEDA